MKKFIIFLFSILLFCGCSIEQISQNLGLSESPLDPEVEQIADAIYLYNEGNYPKACKRFYDYAKDGNVLAMQQTGVCFRDGKGFSKDILRALFWFETAGNYGNIDGLRSAGYIYEYGLGVNKNLEKAIYFYEKATSLGSSEASYDLGLIYLDKNDYKKARIYLDEACFKGKKEACMKLNEMKF